MVHCLAGPSLQHYRGKCIAPLIYTSFIVFVYVHCPLVILSASSVLLAAGAHSSICVGTVVLVEDAFVPLIRS